MWQKIGEAVLRYRLALLLSVVAITGIMAYYAAQVKMSYDFGRAIPTDHPEYQTYLSFKQRFGEDGNILAVGFQTGKYLYMLPFVLAHAYLIFTKLSIAIKNPIGPNIGQTVKTGVLTLILMNAAWVALSEQYYMAFVALALLPISMWVGKKFAVS